MGIRDGAPSTARSGLTWNQNCFKIYYSNDFQEAEIYTNILDTGNMVETLIMVDFVSKRTLKKYA